MAVLDTNVLVGLVSNSDWKYKSATNAVARYRQQGKPLILIPQAVYEFWAVATRPTKERGGLGFTTQHTKQCVQRFFRLATFHEDDHTIYEIWEALVDRHDTKGKPSHDARIVAAMIAHNCSDILSYDERDFSRYEQEYSINKIDPRTVT